MSINSSLPLPPHSRSDKPTFSMDLRKAVSNIKFDLGFGLFHRVIIDQAEDDILRPGSIVNVPVEFRLFQVEINNKTFQ